MPVTDTPKPAIGRIVRYTLHDGPNVGTERPAIIVAVHPDDNAQRVNLVVFLDGDHDDPVRPEPTNHTMWRTHVQHDPGEQPEPGTWRWPPHTRA